MGVVFCTKLELAMGYATPTLKGMAFGLLRTSFAGHVILEIMLLALLP